jgi:hypothetical protein
VAAVLAMMAAPLVAQESTEELKKELDALRREVDGLKADRAQYESKEVTGGAKAGQDAMSPDGDSPVMTALKETKLSGFVDAGYMFSFNQLNTGTHAVNFNNPSRVFDNKSNSFYLNSVQLNVERLATEKMIVGYHLELAAGHDPLVYDGSNVTLQEGWVQILAPLGSGLDIRIGKQATLMGYEVIESKDDLNYSRSLLFGFAENFTNTGVRATYNFSDKFWGTVGLNNGPNTLITAPVPVGSTAQDSTFTDTNHGKAVEIQIGAKPVDGLQATVTLLTGTEDNVSTKDKFYFFDVVVSYSKDKVTLALNYDNSSFQGALPAPFTRAPVSGIAAYGKFQESDMMATALRVEYFSDGEGKAFFPTVAGDTGTGARLIEFTLTEEFKIGGQAIFRIEFRHDDSNQHSFARDGKAARGDNTLGFEAIMPF